MIRYSAYYGTNHRAKPSASCNSLCSLETEYRELQDLRRRVKSAEAVAELTKRRATETPQQQRTAFSRQHHHVVALSPAKVARDC
jgi:hypothetical protein